jgi:hypothetical protein
VTAAQTREDAMTEHSRAATDEEIDRARRTAYPDSLVMSLILRIEEEGGKRDMALRALHAEAAIRTALDEDTVRTWAKRMGWLAPDETIDGLRNEIEAAWAGRDKAAELERDACVRQVKAQAERDEAALWVRRLADRLDEVLSATRWDNHDNWCLAATDAFLPYKQNNDTPPECNCVIRDGWRDVEGARTLLAATKAPT